METKVIISNKIKPISITVLPGKYFLKIQLHTFIQKQTRKLFNYASIETNVSKDLLFVNLDAQKLFRFKTVFLAYDKIRQIIKEKDLSLLDIHDVVVLENVAFETIKEFVEKTKKSSS